MKAMDFNLTLVLKEETQVAENQQERQFPPQQQQPYTEFDKIRDEQARAMRSDLFEFDY